MKPELVFPIILASYSEDKIARELLNNDSMIKTAGLADRFKNLLKWIRFRRETPAKPVTTSPSTPAVTSPSTPAATSPSTPAAAPVATPPSASPSAPNEVKTQAKTSVPSTHDQEKPAIKPADTPGVYKGKKLVNLIQDLVQNPSKVDTIIENLKRKNLNANNIDKLEKVIKLAQENSRLAEWRSTLNKMLFISGNDPRVKDMLQEVSRDQARNAKELRAFGIKPDDLQELNKLDPGSFDPLLNNLKIARSKMQPAGINQAASAANPADIAKPAGAAQSADAAKPAGAAQATKTDQPLDITKNSDKATTWVSDFINNLMVSGSILGAGLGAGHQISQALTKDENTNREILANTAQTAREQTASLTAPTDHRTESDTDGPPKQQIPPLLAAGLGALLVGGLAQRGFGDDEGRYTSLGPALLPMLAGGLVGYGGAEAINRYYA